MKKNCLCLNLLATLMLCGALLTGKLLNCFAPQLILPRMDMPAIAGLTLLALLMEFFLNPCTKRRYGMIAVQGFASYLLLPWAAGMNVGSEMIKYGAAGGTVYLIVVFLFDSALERGSAPAVSGRCALANACILYLAAQAFSGIFI